MLRGVERKGVDSGRGSMQVEPTSKDGAANFEITLTQVTLLMQYAIIVEREWSFYRFTLSWARGEINGDCTI